MPVLLTDRSAERWATVRPSWGDFPRIATLVRDDLSEHGRQGFRRTWPRVAGRLGLGSAPEPARWEVRCLAELAWFCEG